MSLQLGKAPSFTTRENSSESLKQEEPEPEEEEPQNLVKPSRLSMKMTAAIVAGLNNQVKRVRISLFCLFLLFIYLYSLGRLANIFRRYRQGGTVERRIIGRP